MNSIRESIDDPFLRSLAKEAMEKISARSPESPVLEVPPKHLFEGPKYDGKQCAICSRHFKSSAEYLTCKLCKALVCRRTSKGDCKSLHRSNHRLEFLKAGQLNG